MSKVTGKQIKFSKAKELQFKALGFHQNATIKEAFRNAGEDEEIFFTNLNCAFLFDKTSIKSLWEMIKDVSKGGLIMMLGSSNITEHEESEGDDPTRQHKPTLSVFPCTIDPETNNYEIRLNPQNEDQTIGVEHPGIVNFGENGIQRMGDIGFLDI